MISDLTLASIGEGVQGTFSVDTDGKHVEDTYIDSINNEGVMIGFEGEVPQATINFQQFDANDVVAIRVYNELGEFRDVDASSIYANNQLIDIDIGFDFNCIVIFAVDAKTGTEFTIATDAVIVNTAEIDIITPFIIDDATLLANDSDMDNEDTLSLSLDDTNLYDEDSNVIGTVSLNTNGDVLITPSLIDGDPMEVSEGTYATFNYTVSDSAGESISAMATIDFVGSLQNITYDVNVDNAIIVDDGGTLDLSNISNVGVIQLEASESLLNISVNDVIDTGVDGVLVINSSDNDASDQVSIDSSSLTKGDDVSVNGTDYSSYTGVDATLLIEIEDTTPFPS